MTPDEARRLGQYLRAARWKRDWTVEQLGRAAKLNKSTITRFEHGQVSNPRASHLVQIAHALNLPLTDVLTMATHLPAKELPTLPTYLRTKYPQLPEETVTGLSDYFDYLVTTHGYTPGGPAPGEDERPENRPGRQ